MKLKTIISIIIVMLAIAIFWYVSTDDTPPGRINLLFRGKTTKEEVVSTYLQGLKEKNVKKIIKLIPRNYKAEETIQKKFISFGDKDFNNIQIDYNYKELILPCDFEVTIKNDDYNDIICLEQINKNWYLILGRVKDAVPEDEAIIFNEN